MTADRQDRYRAALSAALEGTRNLELCRACLGRIDARRQHPALDAAISLVRDLTDRVHAEFQRETSESE